MLPTSAGRGVIGMAGKRQKNATPTKDQAEAMKRSGIAYPVVWAVIKEWDSKMLIINRLDHHVRTISK